MNGRKLAWTLALAPGLLSCDEAARAGEGRLRVMLSAEASITEGLSVGSDVEDSRDYPVRFSKYLVTVGNIALGRSQGGVSVRRDETFLVDMMKVGTEGVELVLIDPLRAGQWDRFGFDTPAATRETQPYEGVSAEDYDEMVARGDSYWIEGSVERPAAQGGPVSFTIRAPVPTSFHDCEHDGEPGVSVVQGGTATATVTLHGDHIFFNAFPTGTEGTIERLAGYIVEADRDGDGHVDDDELRALDATDAFTRARGYSLDGAPLVVDTAFDFVRAQLATQGHYQGEGECVFTLHEEND